MRKQKLCKCKNDIIYEVDREAFLSKNHKCHVCGEIINIRDEAKDNILEIEEALDIDQIEKRKESEKKLVKRKSIDSMGKSKAKKTLTKKDKRKKTRKNKRRL